MNVLSGLAGLGAVRTFSLTVSGGTLLSSDTVTVSWYTVFGTANTISSTLTSTQKICQNCVNEFYAGCNTGVDFLYYELYKYGQLIIINPHRMHCVRCDLLLQTDKRGWFVCLSVCLSVCWSRP